MKNYRGVIRLLEACSLLFIIGIFGECTKSPTGSPNINPNSNLDTLAPVIGFTDPLNGDVGVPLNVTVVASFNEQLDSTSINTSTFTLQHDSLLVDGVVSVANGVIIFSPDSNLTPNTKYTAKIIGPVMDLAGNQMTNSITWTFTTASFHDTTTPRVIYSFPNQSDSNVALNINPTVTFSEDMDKATILAGTFTLKHDTVQVAGTVTFNDETAIFRPKKDLSPNTTYTAEISVAAQDLAGNNVKVPMVWTFTTGPATDTTTPPGSQSMQRIWRAPR
jgi:hypothetical protein